MNYEQKFLYRLTKVLYIIALLLSVPILFLINYLIHQPTKYIDYDKSYVSKCYRGENSTFKDIGIYYYSDSFLDKENELVINFYCETGIKRSDRLSGTVKGFLPIDVQYTGYGGIYPVYITSGGWFKVIGYTGIALVLVYALLSVLRETINYVFLGKRFDFNWIKHPFNIGIKKT